MLNLSRTIRGLGLLALLCSGVSMCGEVPDWVRKAAAEKLPTYDQDTNAVVLLDETTITVTSADELVEHGRKVVKILRPDGRGEASFQVFFRGKEKVLSAHAWSVDATGREYEVKEKEFVERGVSLGYDLYNDVRVLTTTSPGVAPGSLHAFEYEVRRHPWLNQLGKEFQESIPVHEARLELRLPKGWEYKTSWTGGPAVMPLETAGGGLAWTLRDVPAIEHESMRPALGALSTWLEVAYFGTRQGNNAGSWEAMGGWMNQLTADRRAPTPELSERVKQLTAGKTDFDGKVRALASFLQSDIRYVAIEIGIGGYQPHPAGDIFHLRYGDCKDKATLLSTMLHEVGIESDYVIISTQRGMARPELPALVFNHAILAIELPPGADPSQYRSVVRGKNGQQYLVFDPTDTFTPLGNLRGELQDTYALLVTKAGGELIHTSLQAPETNELARTGQFTLGADGVLTGEIVESRSGDHASYERAALTYATQKQRSEHLEQRLNHSLKGFTAQGVDVQGVDQLQQKLVTTFKVTAPGYSQARGALLLVRPRVMGEQGFALDRKPRKYPFQFDSASRETDSYEIELPQGYVADDLPNPVKIDAKFASYESKVEVVGSKLKYSREYVRRDVLIPPGKTEELRKFLAVIGSDEAAVVVLKRVL